MFWFCDIAFDKLSQVVVKHAIKGQNFNIYFYTKKNAFTEFYIKYINGEIRVGISNVQVLCTQNLHIRGPHPVFNNKI